ncbi:hypothetical protein PVL29_020236 [Vitis rotundifolia]|uniref:Uncharacterized protein n=1 Tax=Vitis rotundifolia TaxID=103349 RepID=A0AA38Z2V8_VITRO|nr:hypothetical protein PVL29_020236 [Vitis rotundifolia]
MWLVTENVPLSLSVTNQPKPHLRILSETQSTIMKKTAKIHEEKEELEEEKGRGVWDCGSPLYDSYELVTVSCIIERNLMKLPSFARSKRVAAAAAAAAATTQASQALPIVISASNRCRLSGKSSKLSSSSSMAGLVGKKKKKETTKTCKNKFYGFCSKIGLLKKLRSQSQ